MLAFLMLFFMDSSFFGQKKYVVKTALVCDLNPGMHTCMHACIK